MNELMETMQAAMRRYLRPDSVLTPGWLAGELIGLLDGPRQREVQGYARRVLESPEAEPITGTPEGHLLQDLHRQLSRWLESRPDSMLHAREAAAAIQSPCSAQCDEEAEHVTFKSGGATVTRGMFVRTDEGAAAPGAETVDQPRICLTVAQLESVAAALAMVDQQEQARTGQRRRGWDHAYLIRCVREALAILNAAGIKGL